MEGKTIECDKKNARISSLGDPGPLRLNAVASDFHKQLVVGLGFGQRESLIQDGSDCAESKQREREREREREDSGGTTHFSRKTWP
jgi:hypothetical protein